MVPSYRIPFFRQLTQLGKSSGIEYVIASTSEFSGSDLFEEADSFLHIRLVGNFYQIFGRSLDVLKVGQLSHGVDLVISEHALKNLFAYRSLFMSRPTRFAFWGHGKTYTKSNTKFEEMLKNYLLCRGDWFFGYTAKGVDFAVEGGFDRSRTTIIQNSTDTLQLQKYMASQLEDRVELFKQEYQLSNSRVAVFIGSLEASKRLDFLFEASKKVKAAIPDFQLLVFGSGPLQNQVIEESTNFDFIKYCGPANSELKAIVSKFAEMILMPGRVGLISVDALTLGLPIITTKWKWHAPEFEYLQDGINSVISSDNIDEYSEEVIKLLNSDPRLTSLKNRCKIDSKKYSMEEMAQNFHAGVLKALSVPGRAKKGFLISGYSGRGEK